METGSKKVTATAIFLLLALLSSLFFNWVYFTRKNDMSALSNENDNLKAGIISAEEENASLKKGVEQLEGKVDTLYLELSENQRRLIIQNRKYENLKKEFAQLPTASRDSIIRNYIRANQ